MSAAILTDVVRAVLVAVIAVIVGYPCWRGVALLVEWRRDRREFDRQLGEALHALHSCCPWCAVWDDDRSET